MKRDNGLWSHRIGEGAEQSILHPHLLTDSPWMPLGNTLLMAFNIPPAHSHLLH